MGSGAKLTLDEALDIVLSRAKPIGGAAWPEEEVGLSRADGRILARDAIAPANIPAWDNSAMDGYALRCADAAIGAALRVSQRIAAGSNPPPLEPGTAARIFTGAPIPLGADAVLVQELADAIGDGTAFGSVGPRSAPKPGAAIRRAGEDAAKGSAILRKGTRLTPVHLAAAAGLGLSSLRVARKPKVAYFSTGDELREPQGAEHAALAPGAIYSSSRSFLGPMLARLGCEPIDLGIVADRSEATHEALRRGASLADVVLTTGGVGAGEEDHIANAVAALGHADLWSLAIKPGKPFAMGMAAGALFIGLPGNPVASFATFALLARPLLLRLQGASDPLHRSASSPAAFRYAAAKGRREFPRVSLGEGGRLELLSNQGSAAMCALAGACGLADIAPGQAVEPGDFVRWIPFDSLM